MKRVINILLISSLLCLFLSPFSKVSGADCTDTSKVFSSSYDLTVSFDAEGDGLFHQKVSLKNLVAGCFASEYSLKINSTKVRSVSGEDSLGSLLVKVSKDKQSTLISAKLNEEIIGKNKSVAFGLKFRLEDLAAKQGLVWDLTVPQITTSEKVTAYNLKVVAPVSWGKVFMVSPKPERVKTSKKQTALTFGKEEALNKTVSASFGQYQEISFKFKQQLENTGFLSKKFQIYLPPDTEKQQVLLTKITPQPEKIKTDELGNYSAEFKVGGWQTREVLIEGVVKIAGEGNKFTPPITFSGKNLERMKASSRFIQVQDRLVQEKAKKLKTIEAIYDFVTEYLEYDTKAFEAGKSERKGAAQLLRKKSLATNIDFVDLFLALTKAAGIPAREVFGFTLADGKGFKPTFIGQPLNTSHMHVWAQVYDSDKNIWVNVDPTWGRTLSADYVRESSPDRFILLITTSGDKIEALEDLVLSADNMRIAPAKQSSDFSPKVDLGISIDQAFAGFPIDLVVKLKNRSGVALTAGKISVSTEDISLINSKDIKLQVIFPFETRSYKIKLRAGNIFKTTRAKVKIDFEAESGGSQVKMSEAKNVIVKSFFSLGIQQILLFMLVVLLLVGVFTPKIRAYLRK
ncbi:MAG TPA: transglutaminase-like domain-containing protein [Candidatus Nanoarchaeia archaeon]